MTGAQAQIRHNWRQSLVEHREKPVTPRIWLPRPDRRRHLKITLHLLMPIFQDRHNLKDSKYHQYNHYNSNNGNRDGNSGLTNIRKARCQSVVLPDLRLGQAVIKTRRNPGGSPRKLGERRHLDLPIDHWWRAGEFPKIKAVRQRPIR